MCCGELRFRAGSGSGRTKWKIQSWRGNPRRRRFCNSHYIRTCWGKIQETMPEFLWVVPPGEGFAGEKYRVSEYAAYFTERAGAFAQGEQLWRTGVQRSLSCG